MTRRAALLNFLMFALAIVPTLHAAQASQTPDLTGKWNGTFIITVNGQTENDQAFLSLTQKGTEITGTAGPSLEQQWPLANGKVDGTKVTFEAQAGGPSIKFVLTLIDGRLKGDASAENDGQSMTAKVDVGRSK